MTDDKTQLGDQPIEVEFREVMNSLAFALDQILNGQEAMQDKSKRKNGFVLMVFPFSDNSGRCNYISNGANREDIANLFEEQAKRFREVPDAGPGEA